MKPRKILVTPQASRDLNTILAWYKREFGPHTAAKVARTLQAGIRACSRVHLSHAVRADLPEGYYRVAAKTHIVVFQTEADTARIVRVLHGARDIAAVLEQEND